MQTIDTEKDQDISQETQEIEEFIPKKLISLKTIREREARKAKSEAIKEKHEDQELHNTFNKYTFKRN
jgi:hypothetical protein